MEIKSKIRGAAKFWPALSDANGLQPMWATCPLLPEPSACPSGLGNGRGTLPSSTRKSREHGALPGPFALWRVGAIAEQNTIFKGGSSYSFFWQHVRQLLRNTEWFMLEEIFKISKSNHKPRAANSANFSTQDEGVHELTVQRHPEM